MGYPGHGNEDAPEGGFVKRDTLAEIGEALTAQRNALHKSAATTALDRLVDRAFFKAQKLHEAIKHAFPGLVFAHGAIKSDYVFYIPEEIVNGEPVPQHIIFTNWHRAGWRYPLFDVVAYGLIYGFSPLQRQQLLEQYLGSPPTPQDIMYSEQLLCMLIIRNAFWALQHLAESGYKLDDYAPFFEAKAARNADAPDLPLALNHAKEQLQHALSMCPHLTPDDESIEIPID